ncbi:MAG: thioredoxin domain-containing protein [Gammaproteobacteria bacterium]|nr:thioredoxin domain-containing protein [Gammaproteobacteria bacterium]
MALAAHPDENAINRLSSETSPYLLQHADNPVDWYPWGPAALAAARAENKPILLSIGYSACHWCHVMAHESFADPATAAVMNRLFINVKVDREERPDIDKIYQAAHQLITRRNGGWPLTVFLLPDNQQPFFAGTYFPKDALHGMPAFTDLLLQVAQYFAAHQAELAEQAAAVVRAMAALEGPEAPAGAALTRAPLDGLRRQLASNFDAEWGGFGNAPKFPHPSSLEYLLRHWRASAHSPEPDVQALFMVALTLTRMVEGGVFDQLGGGFFRYAVDREWGLPHFEKMLYDNGALLALLAQLWQASGDDTFRAAAAATADWLLRDMRSPAGGFYAALDADSEGGEGAFYAWTPAAVAELLEPAAAAVVARRFGLDGPPNFADRWHLRVRADLATAAAAAGVPESRARALLEAGCEVLLRARNERVGPARDAKQLTAWNALTVRGLALAGRALDRADLLDAAAAAVAFLRRELWVEGRLLACYTAGQARLPAYLDDYALLLDALLELLQTRWDDDHLQFAIALADTLLEEFADTERGGFYFTARDHEQLAHRTRSFSDDSLPSGNGVAARALGRLGHLLGAPRYLAAAEATLRAAQAAMEEFPHGHAALITALEEYLHPPEIIVIRGVRAEAEAWAHTVAAVYAPRRLIFAIPADADGLPAGLAQRAAGDACCAYVCQGSQCGLPARSLTELLAAVRESDGPPPDER